MVSLRYKRRIKSKEGEICIWVNTNIDFINKITELKDIYVNDNKIKVVTEIKYMIIPSQTRN